MSAITTMTDLMGEVVTLRQQLAEVTRLSDSRRMVMDHQATMLNVSVQQLAEAQREILERDRGDRFYTWLHKSD